MKLNLNNNFIINMLDPVNPQDGATKSYVDKGLSALRTTCTYTADHTLAVTDNGKTFVMDNDSVHTFTLPIVDSSNIGLWFTIAKLNTGKLIIQAQPGNYINNSSSGGTIYDDSTNKYSNVTIQLISATQWATTGGSGIWAST